MRRKGWIPTVTGNLSFSALGNAARPKRILSSFREIRGKQYILVVQRRRTTDALFGVFGDLLNYLLSRDGWFTFFLFAEVENDDGSDIHGTADIICCIIPDEELQRSLTIISNTRGFLLSSRDYEYGFSWSRERAALLTTECGLDPIAGRILRSGECTLALPDNINHEDQEILLSQAYFFLRDIAHIHQHHERNSDTILSVYPEIDEAGRAWSDRVLFALHRWIIQQKRRKDHLGSIRSIGILSYAEVFRNNFCITKSRPSHQRFKPDNLRDSLNSSVTEYAAIENSSRNPVALGAIVVSALLFCLGMLVNIDQEEVRRSSAFDAILYLKLQSLVNENPLISTGVALVVILSIGFGFIYHRRLTFQVSDFIRFSISFGPRLAKFIRLMFGGFLILMAIGMINSVIA